MNLTLSQNGKTYSILSLAESIRWSGDKSSISRELAVTLYYEEGGVIPAIGDTATLTSDAETLFVGVILQRSLASEAQTMDFTAFDFGYYLGRNDGTYRFVGSSPEAITRRVCADKKVAISAMPASGVTVSRKFSAVPLHHLITTAWSLAAEKSGKSYTIRYAPQGLLVKERTEGIENLVIRAEQHLMDATLKEDATQMCNSVAIYDSNGNFLRQTENKDAQALYGMMEQHIIQTVDGSLDADASAKMLLQDGLLVRTVSVNLLGDTSLLTGETVVVQESKTGLAGVFWIDADVHTWKLGNYYTALTLNYRNAMATASAGGAVD